MDSDRSPSVPPSPAHLRLTLDHLGGRHARFIDTEGGSDFEMFLPLDRWEQMGSPSELTAALGALSPAGSRQGRAAPLSPEPHDASEWVGGVFHEDPPPPPPPYQQHLASRLRYLADAGADVQTIRQHLRLAAAALDALAPPAAEEAKPTPAPLAEPEPLLMQANARAHPATPHAYNHGWAPSCGLLGCAPVSPVSPAPAPQGPEEPKATPPSPEPHTGQRWELADFEPVTGHLHRCASSDGWHSCDHDCAAWLYVLASDPVLVAAAPAPGEAERGASSALARVLNGEWVPMLDPSPSYEDAPCWVPVDADGDRLFGPDNRPLPNEPMTPSEVAAVNAARPRPEEADPTVTNGDRGDS